MSAAAAQLPDSGDCADADAGGGGGAAELLEQAAQCLANALVLSSACNSSPDKALEGPQHGPVQAPDGSGGRDGDAPGAQEGFASWPHKGYESGSSAVAAQPGTAPDADTGGTTEGSAAAAGSSAAVAAPPEVGSSAKTTAGAPHAGDEGLRTGGEEVTAAKELPAHAEGEHWQAGVVRLAAQGASSWVALRRGDPRGALEHARALLQVGAYRSLWRITLAACMCTLVNGTLARRRKAGLRLASDCSLAWRGQCNASGALRAHACVLGTECGDDATEEYPYYDRRRMCHRTCAGLHSGMRPKPWLLWAKAGMRRSIWWPPCRRALQMSLQMRCACVYC